MERDTTFSMTMLRILLVGLAVPVLGLAMTGCVVAGYSSGGGFFLWPGGLGLLAIILLAVFLLRRR